MLYSDSFSFSICISYKFIGWEEIAIEMKEEFDSFENIGKKHFFSIYQAKSASNKSYTLNCKFLLLFRLMHEHWTEKHCFGLIYLQSLTDSN